MSLPQVVLVALAILLLVGAMRAADFSWRTSFAVLIVLSAIAAALSAASIETALHLT